MQQVQLNVDDEFKALGDALQVAIADIKAKAAVTQDLSDVAAKLIPALGGLANFSGDVKKAANQVYLVYSIASALEPKA